MVNNDRLLIIGIFEIIFYFSKYLKLFRISEHRGYVQLTISPIYFIFHLWRMLSNRTKGGLGYKILTCFVSSKHQVKFSETFM